MKLSHALALILIPLLSVVTAVAATWSQRVRDTCFFVMVFFAVLVERMDVNFFSEAWYRGTTRGVQVSFPEIIAFGLIVGCRLGRRDEEQRRWFWPASLGLMLLYFFYACLSVITADLKIFGAFELTKIFASIVVFLASTWYLRSKREWSILLVALAFSVGFEALWAVKQRFITHLDRVEGTLDHANSLSMYFCLTTPLLIAGALGGWTRLLRWACAASAFLAAVGLLLTFSRAGIPIFSVVALGTFIMCASWQLTTSRIIVRSLVTLAILGVAATAWGTMKGRYAEATLQEEFLDAHVDGRGIYLRLAKNIASDHFFGVGLNNWSYYVSLTYGPQLGFPFTDYDYLTSIYGKKDDKVFGNSYLAAPAHNLAALTLGELGVPGLVLFLALWFRWFSMGFRFLFDPRGDPRRTMGVGLFFCICGIFGQSITEWVYRQTPILFTFYILLGALASVVANRKRERREQTPTAAPAPWVATPSEELVAGGV